MNLIFSHDAALDLHIRKDDIRSRPHGGALWANCIFCLRIDHSPCNWTCHSTLLPTCIAILGANSEIVLGPVNHVYCYFRNCYQFVSIQALHLGGKLESTSIAFIRVLIVMVKFCYLDHFGWALITLDWILHWMVVSNNI